MDLLDKVKQKIDSLYSCDAAYILAHAAWSACDHRKPPGPSALEVSAKLDSSNTEIVQQLYDITAHYDYSNADQTEMLRWLHQRDFSGYIAKQLKTTKKKLVDWE